jgi:hypothetical protein
VIASDGERALPYFFLAYAHTPERPWVSRLYQELERQILEHTDWPTDRPAGFMDQSGIRLGDDWRETIAGALSTCRVFVPLYSRRYFTRPECGREWHAFTRRLGSQRALRGAAAAPIVPALWTPVTDEHVPTVAQKIQVDFRSVHHAYADEGLYTLIKNSAYRPTYLRVVRHLAMQIIAAAEQVPLSPCPPTDLDLAVDAFSSGTEVSEQVPANRRLTIMLAAPVSGRTPEGRDQSSSRPSCRETTVGTRSCERAMNAAESAIVWSAWPGNGRQAPAWSP